MPLLLTTKDFAILETMRDRCLSPRSAYGQLLARKIAEAEIVFSDDIEADSVTLNTRLRYSRNGGGAAACLLVQAEVHGVVGLTLPLTTLRGLALLGLRAGESVTVIDDSGREETLHVTQVDYQPEAARRERSQLASERMASRPHLRLVHSAERVALRLPETIWPDDPGPSAA